MDKAHELTLISSRCMACSFNTDGLLCVEFKPQSLAESIPPFPQNIQAGDVVTISRYEVDDMGPVALYIREHLCKLLARLDLFVNNHRKSKLYVTGAPGCGKTCFFWMWANMLLLGGKRVLFKQYRKGKACQIWILEDNQTLRLTSPLLENSNLVEVVKAVLDARSSEKLFDVCIYDGVRQNDDVNVIVMAVLDVRSGKKEDASISKLVFVTSMYFHISDGDEEIIKGIAVTMSFESWREEEYELAASTALATSERTLPIFRSDWNILVNDTADDGAIIGDQQPFGLPQILEVIRQKYHYAGGCARYMFDRHMVDLLRTLKSMFRQVTDPLVFTQTILSDKTSDAVNCLMQQFVSEKEGETMCTPVSKYVLLLAFKKCRAEMTGAVVAVAEATENRSLKGWAFELKQLDEITLALEANRTNLSVITPSTVTNSKLTFIPRSEANFNGSEITEGSVDNGCVIWCSKVNQGLFDAAFYFDETLLTLHFTVSTTHNLKLHYMTALRRSLVKMNVVVNRMVHLCIVEKESLDQFSFDDPEGHAASTRFNVGTFTVEVDYTGELNKKERFALTTANSVQPNGQTHYVSLAV